jgi:hypothetical protein
MSKFLPFALLALSLNVCLNACQAPLVNSPNNSPNQTTGKTPPAIPKFPSQGAVPSADPAAANLAKRLPMGAPMADSASAESSAGGGGSASGALAPAAPLAAAPALSTSPTSKSGVSSGRSDLARPGLVAPEPFPMKPGPQPQAGLLTAGEWNDLKNWPFWLELMQDQQWSGMPGIWGIYNQKRIQVTVTGPAGALADLPVQVYASGSDKLLFEGRTNVLGQADLFPAIGSSSQVQPFQTQQDQQSQISVKEPTLSKLEVRVNLGQETLKQELSLSGNGLQTLNFKAETALDPAVNADLMLVVDTTGSMGDELEYLKSELKNVASQISSQNRKDLKLRLSTNFYKDLSDEYVVRPFPFSENPDTVAQQLSQQSANGGGDFPEAVDAALQDAVDEHEWSATARARLLFLVLDAPPHQDPKNLTRLRTSLLRAAAKGIRIIPVASSGIDKETEFLLRMMAISTGGRYVFLTDDSGIGSGHIKPTVGSFTVEKLNALMVRVANEYISGQASAPVPAKTNDQQQ